MGPPQIDEACSIMFAQPAETSKSPKAAANNIPKYVISSALNINQGFIKTVPGKDDYSSISGYDAFKEIV